MSIIGRIADALQGIPLKDECWHALPRTVFDEYFPIQ